MSTGTQPNPTPKTLHTPAAREPAPTCNILQDPGRLSLSKPCTPPHGECTNQEKARAMRGSGDVCPRCQGP
jgi:hypothetical protein